MPWQQIHWFWCDERFVPRTDARSNYAMAQALLFAAAVPDARPEARITLTYPAARLRPVGRLHWFLDRAVAPHAG